MKYKPLFDNLVCKIIKRAESAKIGSIQLPSKDLAITTAKVLDVGCDIKHIKVDNVIAINLRYAHILNELDDIYMLQEKDVLALVEDFDGDQ